MFYEESFGDPKWQSWSDLMEATIGTLSNTGERVSVTEVGMGNGTEVIMKLLGEHCGGITSIEVEKDWYERWKHVPTKAIHAPLGEPEWIRHNLDSFAADIVFIDGICCSRVICLNFALRIPEVKAIIMHDTEDSSEVNYHYKEWASYPDGVEFFQYRDESQHPNSTIISRSSVLVEQVKGRLNGKAHHAQT